MSVLETVLVFVVIPLALYGVITLMTLWPKFARGPRYRPGQEWEHEPVWWAGNPDGITAGEVALRHAAESENEVVEKPVRTARGGARGSW